MALHEPGIGDCQHRRFHPPSVTEGAQRTRLPDMLCHIETTDSIPWSAQQIGNLRLRELAALGSCRTPSTGKYRRSTRIRAQCGSYLIWL